MVEALEGVSDPAELAGELGQGTRRRIASLSKAHQLARVGNPCALPEIRELLAPGRPAGCTTQGRAGDAAAAEAGGDARGREPGSFPFPPDVLK